MEYIKQDDNHLKVTEIKTVEDVYGYDWILNEIALAEQRKQREINKYDERLVWLNKLKAEADKLGLKKKEEKEEEFIVKG